MKRTFTLTALCAGLLLAAGAFGGQDIFVAARDGAVRVSPHIYNNEEDMDGLLAAI